MASGNGWLVLPAAPTSGVMTLTGLPQTNNVATSLLCKGVFDATFQLIGTYSTTMAVNVRYTLAPDYATSTKSNLWITATTLQASAAYTLVTMHVVALSLNVQTASSNDNYGVAWFWSDKR